MPAKFSALQASMAMANRTGRSDHAPARDQSGRVLLNGADVTRLSVAQHRARAFRTFRPTAAMSARSPKCPLPTMRFLACRENTRAACFAAFARLGNPRKRSWRALEFAVPESISRPENFPAAICRS
jgi:hypothetical protein